jgi:hypothetical protein
VGTIVQQWDEGTKYSFQHDLFCSMPYRGQSGCSGQSRFLKLRQGEADLLAEPIDAGARGSMQKEKS